MKTILFVSYSGPLPCTDGKRQRTYALIDALERKYKIDFVIIDNKEDYTRACEEFSSPNVSFYFIQSVHKKKILLNRSLLFQTNPSVHDFLLELIRANQYPFIFTRYIHPISHIPKGIKIVTDVDDDFEEVFHTRIRAEMNWLRKVKIWQFFMRHRYFYRKLLKRIDLAITVKADDLKGKSMVLPNLPFQMLLNAAVPFQSCTDYKVLFVGKLSYAPNRKGLLWFLKYVWPQLLVAIPTIRLTVVSSTDVDYKNKELIDLIEGNSQVELKIAAADLKEIYLNHAVVISPIFQGGGSSIKVAEALLMGRPVVSSAFGVRGFADENTQHFISSSDDPVQFKNRIHWALRNSDALITLQKNSYEYARSKYSLVEWSNNLINNL